MIDWKAAADVYWTQVSDQADVHLAVKAIVKAALGDAVLYRIDGVCKYGTETYHDFCHRVVQVWPPEDNNA